MPKANIILRSIICMTLAISLPTSVQADDAKKQELRSVIESMQSADTMHSITYDGQPTIEDAGSYFAITMPHAHADIFDLDINLGMFAINAAPHEKAGQWKMSLATPTPIFVRHKKKNDTIQIDIGGQSAAGLWSSETNSFLKYKGEYRDIRIANAENTSLGQTPLIQINNNNDMNAQGEVTGKSAFTMKDFSIEVMDKNTNKKRNMLIGNAAANFELRGVNLKKINQLRKQMPTIEAGLKMNPSDVFLLVANLFEALGDGTTSIYSAENISFSEGDTNNLINKVLVGIETRGFREDKASLRLFSNLDAKNLKVKKALDPQFANIDMTLGNMPLNQLYKMFGSVVKSEKAKANSGLLTLMIKVPMLLAQNESFMKFTDTKIGNELYEMHIDGYVKADINALKTAIADVNISIHGYETLRAEAKRLATTNPEQSQNILNRLEMFERYMPYAKTSQDTQGRSVNMFNIKLDDQGIITVNGQAVEAENDNAKALP